jgi:signal transduction histidine kinase
MDIKLVSNDGHLYKLCREILAEMPGHPCTFAAVSIEGTAAGADLYIWDYQPNISIPEHWSASKHLFLVPLKDLSAFRKRTEITEANVLLKPVTRAMLAAFLGLAISNQAVTSLRADRDEILQYLIQTNLKLQEYDQDRTNFLARAVHDFRAPLTALSGYCG